MASLLLRPCRSSYDSNPSLLPGNAKSNVDLRHRLLSNAQFHSGKLKNGSSKGRIFFRGVTMFVPETQTSILLVYSAICSLNVQNMISLVLTRHHVVGLLDV